MSFEAILFLAVLVLSAKLGGELFHRIKQPTIIGNVIAGIIIGPAFFAIVEPAESIDLFISIGVFFLFFLIGLEEIDLPGLFRVLRGRIFAGSVLGFLIPFVVGTIFAVSIDISLVKSMAIASVIGASSLGVTAKILTDMGKLRSTIGLEIFTITGIVEFIAIIFTSVIIQVDVTQSFQFSEFMWLFVQMIIFFAISGLLAVFVLPRFFRIIKNHLQAQQIYFGVVIGMILLVAYFAEISGIHGAIGAMLLGIAISRMNRDEYTEISKSVNAVGYGIFIPIFFAGIGIHFTLDFLQLPIWVIVGFLAIIIGVKFVGSLVAVKVAKMRPTTTVAYGVMSKGAVDLALMLSLLSINLIEKDLFSLLVFGTLITMVISSVELQRKLKKVVQVKIGTSELGFLPIYFRKTVSDKKAEDVMELDYSKTIPDENFERFQIEYDLVKKPFLVLDGEKLVGIVSKKDFDKVHKKNRLQLKVSDVMYKKFHTVIPNEYLFSVIQKMNLDPYDVIPVVSPTTEGKVIGLVTSEKIMNLLVQQEGKEIK